LLQIFRGAVPAASERSERARRPDEKKVRAFVIVVAGVRLRVRGLDLEIDAELRSLRAPELLVALLELLDGAFAVIDEIEFDVGLLEKSIRDVVAHDAAAGRVHDRALFLLKHAAFADQ
jgi:hypothetical protein